jgi:RNA polymerase sigma-70 factor (ECF subfamily)
VRVQRIDTEPFPVPIRPAAPNGTRLAGAVTWQTMEITSNEIADEALLNRIAEGDAAAFASFYDRHSNLLFSIATHVLRDDREAEDVLQEAMVLLWERATTYDHSLGKPLSWVVTLTRNKAIDRLRSLKRRQHRTSQPLDELESVLADPAASASDSAMSRESAGLVRAALVTLPGEQRQAIELAFFRGLSHFEIADRLRVPLGTIKARIRRGMLFLRDALEGSL